MTNMYSSILLYLGDWATTVVTRIKIIVSSVGECNLMIKRPDSRIQFLIKTFSPHFQNSRHQTIPLVFAFKAPVSQVCTNEQEETILLLPWK